MPAGDTSHGTHVTTDAQSWSGVKTFSNRINANSGIRIGAADNDIGWFLNSNRITAGTSVARDVNVGSLLVSSAWADASKVPTNGIYSKGGITIGNGRISITNSTYGTLTIGSQNTAYTHYETTGGIHWFNKNVAAQGDFYGGSSYNRRLAYVDELPTNNNQLTNGAGYITSSGSITGNAATATKLITARSIGLSGDFTGSANFDGSGNITIDAYNKYSSAYKGGANSKPYCLIAQSGTATGSWVDKSIILDLEQGYIGGCYGRIKIELRTDNVANSNVGQGSASWIYRCGFAVDSVKIGVRNTSGATYVDVFYVCPGTYSSITIRQVGGGARGSVSPTFTLVNSSETGSASSNCWNSIENAATALHNQAYSGIYDAKDGANVNYANTAGGVAWTNVSGKPTTFAPAAHDHTYIKDKDNYSFTGLNLPKTFDQGISCGFVQADAIFPSYGSVLTCRTYSGGGGTLQLYAPYSATYGGERLMARFGNYDSSSGNSWTALKEIAWLEDVPSLSGYSKKASAETLSGAKTFSAAATFSAGLSSGGNVTVTGKVSASSGFYEESDERLKSFKDPIKVDLEKLSKLRKSYFTFNSDPDNLQIGVSAQEIQSLYPEIVSENENGNLTVAYDKLSVIALAAVDQLSTELNTLKDELQQIKAHLNLI